jgi:adenosylhomocysteine nucleosidase
MSRVAIAIVAALEREVGALVRRPKEEWRVSEKEHAGRSFRFFSRDEAVLVCGGIGAEAARRAAEAVIALYAPAAVYSVGFAGALDPSLRVADLVQPRRVVNAGDGSSVSLDRGEGVLVSFGSVASAAQKVKLRESFGAQVVDMEAAAVARAAEARGVGFGVVKVISDEFGFTFPTMERFVDSDGQFLEMRFALYAGVRPWLWPKVVSMARNSKRAANALSDWLSDWLQKMDRTPAVASAEVRGDAQGMEAIPRR